MWQNYWFELPQNKTSHSKQSKFVLDNNLRSRGEPRTREIPALRHKPKKKKGKHHSCPTAKLAVSTVTKEILMVTPRSVGNDTTSSSYGQKHNSLTWATKVKPPTIPLQKLENGHLPPLTEITVQETQAQHHICQNLDRLQCSNFIFFYYKKVITERVFRP